MESKKTGLLASALEYLSKASLSLAIVYAIGLIISIIVVVIVYSRGFNIFYTPITGVESRELLEELFTTIGFVVDISIYWEIVSTVIVIIVFILFLYKSLRMLKEYSVDEYSTPKTMVSLGYLIGYPLLTIGSTLLLYNLKDLITRIPSSHTSNTEVGRWIMQQFLQMFGSAVITLIGGLLLLIGYIGLIILLYRLSKTFRGKLDIAWITILIAFIVSFSSSLSYIGSIIGNALWTIAFTILYIEAKKLSTIVKIEPSTVLKKTRIPPPPPPIL